MEIGLPSTDKGRCIIQQKIFWRNQVRSEIAASPSLLKGFRSNSHLAEIEDGRDGGPCLSQSARFQQPLDVTKRPNSVRGRETIDLWFICYLLVSSTPDHCVQT